jgi:hypothetical protein
MVRRASIRQITFWRLMAAAIMPRSPFTRSAARRYFGRLSCSSLVQARCRSITVLPSDDVNQSGVLTPDQVNNYKALMCHIHHIIEELINVPAGEPPNHLLIFIHGGLNTQQDALDRAREDIPAMMQAPLDPRFISGSKIFPLFYIWPSGFFDSYADATLNYAQGEYGTPLRQVEAPLYFGTDLAETVAHAPLDLVKSVRRFADTFFGAGDEPAGWGCGLDATHFGCDELGALNSILCTPPFIWGLLRYDWFRSRPSTLAPARGKTWSRVLASASQNM